MDHPPPYSPRPAPLTNRDLETASIHSAAPSYTSNAPTYTSTSTPTVGSLPSPYATPSSSSAHRHPSTPSLAAFRQSSWSPTSNNPTARHYHSVAHRRALSHTSQTRSTLLAAALSGDRRDRDQAIAAMKHRMDAETRAREMRTREDPCLVGEAAARAAREERERESREDGVRVLEREDR
ncbi:hypothetical protein LARI1_G008254, partial [Lachnellula arida]